MKLVKKISAKDILGNVAKYVSENMEVGETAKAYAVAGIAKGIETGTSSFGEWTAFIGDFQAVNYTDDETYRGSKVFCPDVLIPHLRSGLEKTDTIEFAYEVDITRLQNDPNTNAVSYEYTTVPKVEVQNSDNLAHLTKLISPPVEPITEDKPAVENKKSKK